MDPRLQTQVFWLELRKKTSADGKVGKGLCNIWCGHALGVLDKEIPGHDFQPYRVYAREAKEIPLIEVNFHEWLETKMEHRKFVADGTAGQIDDRFLRGYYGFVDNLPQGNLRRVYEHKKCQPGITIPRLMIEPCRAYIEV